MTRQSWISLLFFIGMAQMVSAQHFQSNIDTANALSQNEGKQMMLVFTGSDWCKPCILLKRDVLQTAEFGDFADANLVMVNLDFPYRKKNQLPEKQRHYNSAMADLYNPEGYFPRVLILDENKQVIRQIDYKVGMSAESFIQQVKDSI